MYARLGAEVAEYLRPLDVKVDRLDARLLAIAAAEFLDLVAARLEEAKVHAHQHRRPVAGLGSPGSCLDAEVAIAFVVGAGQQRQQRHLVDGADQRQALALGLLARVLVVFGLGQFDEHAEVVKARDQGLDGVDDSLERLELADDILGAARVPEARQGHPVFDGLQLSLLCREVKESLEWS